MTSAALQRDTSQPQRHGEMLAAALLDVQRRLLTVRTGDHDLHSGLFGGLARNALQVLAAIHPQPTPRRGDTTAPSESS